MVEEITIKNVLSFKDEVCLSFEATTEHLYDESHIVTMPNGMRLLRLGIVYGANASGKSNLLLALDGLCNFCLFDPKNMDDRIAIEPFLLDPHTPSQPSEYNLRFWLNGIRYWYRLIVTERQVLHERLSFYKTVQPVMVFERTLVDGESVIKFNQSVQKVDNDVQKAISLHCLPNMSFFAVRGHVNVKMEHVDAVREWFRTCFMPMIGPRTNMSKYGQRKISEDIEFKDYLLNFLNMADFNIHGIVDHIEEVEDKRAKLIVDDDSYIMEIRKKETPAMKKQHVLTFEHQVETERGKELYELAMEQQSAGTKRVLGVEAAVYDALKKNAFLMIDEMESSLHPRLMSYIIQRFLLERCESQLLITTHYDGLLRSMDDLIRKDNVWFVEKDKAGVSELYSLVEFKGLHQISHFEKAYINGRFGALPKFKD